MASPVPPLFFGGGGFPHEYQTNRKKRKMSYFKSSIMFVHDLLHPVPELPLLGRLHQLQGVAHPNTGLRVPYRVSSFIMFKV